MVQHQQRVLSSSSSSSSHLPVLYNPLLNCIFNNPNHTKSPFKNVIEELKLKHNQYTIVVPSAHILNEFHDPATDNSTSKTLLRDLCYNNEEFIKAHLIKTGTPVSSTITPISKEQSVIYNTMNNKQVLIKNRMIYTGKGFKRSLKLKIASISYFKSFCDYFPKGCQFMIIYIESSLIGGLPPPPPIRRISPPLPESNGSIRSNTSSSHDLDSITFEKLLRGFPLLSKAVSDKFYQLFHHNNYQFHQLRMHSRKKLKNIKIEFQKILDEAFNIISDSVKEENPNSEQTYNLINHIVSMYPGIDLNKLVHEYVELNLYDVLWSQLIFQYNYPNDDKESYDPEAIKNLTASDYDKLSCLSLNQLDVPVSEPWHMNELHERIYLAVQEFKKLSDSSVLNSTSKTAVVYKTIEILSQSTKSSKLIIDADTLMALLIMTVAHSRVDNLEAHIYYIKNFSSSDRANDGQFNYIMSNLDAVLCHLSDRKTVNGFVQLAQSSQLNYDLWSTIFDEDVDKSRKIIESVQEKYTDKELPESHYLRSKNISCESALNFAIKAKNFKVYDLLMNSDPQWFSIDDILFDMNVMNNQNLLMYGLIEETDERIVDDLINIITNNATVAEQIAYYNMRDKYGRAVGHYLFHNHKLISKIGHLIDWELKDNNSHTPLFSLCRCYDHPNYTEIVKTGFDVVYAKYGKKGIDFDKHVDKSGNSLLHVILKGIPETRILSNTENLININILNLKNLTPLMLYVKYNRLENLQNILLDDRLEFMYEENKTCYNVFDYLSFSMAKSLNSEKLKSIENLLVDYYLTNYFPSPNATGSGSGSGSGTGNAADGALLFAQNGKYDSNSRDWLIQFKNSKGNVGVKSVTLLKQLMYLNKLKRPFSTFLENDIFWRNYSTNYSTSPMFHKFRVNKLINRFNIMLQSIVFQENIDGKSFFKAFISGDGMDTSILESKQKIMARFESEKESLGVVKLKRNHIQEMEFFLNFTQDEIKKWAQVVGKMTKLVLIGEQKQLDLKNVEDVTHSRLNEKAFFSKNFDISEYTPQSGSFGHFGDYMLWIEQVGFELLKNINKISTDVNLWKELYHNICHVNQELKSMELVTDG
ncbi:hypothetical protein KGF56_003591 [Candida oxycetoniae]|uniref:VPS9 domain-containing protein n=1 Tax=Candida oxycetoniae TaxID=497107 RepID=A0AAI9SVK9_9ASCO|nr:uncharacterized protein KGF56_003591 [Candida oxycetoniae]KAI3403664.2 hypothetical protein KGF56_003591 [Candida oxycetoniae]